MNRGPDAAARLERELMAMAGKAGLAIALEDVGSIPWASALFVGEQVRLSLCGPDTAAFAAWSHALPEMEFALRGHLVIDMTIDRVIVADDVRRCGMLALLIEDSAGGPS